MRNAKEVIAAAVVDIELKKKCTRQLYSPLFDLGRRDAYHQIH